TRMREFYDGWRARLRELEFDRLSQEGKVDYVLLDSYLIHQLALLDRDAKQRAEVAPLLGFEDRLLALQDSRRNLETIDQAAIPSSPGGRATRIAGSTPRSFAMRARCGSASWGFHRMRSLDRTRARSSATRSERMGSRKISATR